MNIKQLYCEHCNWQGTSDKLQEVWAANPNDPNDPYLQVSQTCPNCFSDKFLKERIQTTVMEEL
jgi:hypothetical protein